MQKSEMKCDIGMIGLGVMGRNLVLNMTDHGYTVAGFDTDQNKVNCLLSESNHAYGSNNIEGFLKLLKKPRSIMLLVPAGAPVDTVIQELLPHLEKGDLIIDAGNSHFTDTNARTQYLHERDIQFLGIGISGGEKGARLGPSIMPGGTKEAYDQIHAILEAVAAKVGNEPCVTYLGHGSAGHYVKMVHNGIEYGIMQLIAETYDLMKRGANFDNQQLRAIYQSWNENETNSYLIEITSHIFAKQDEKTGKDLIDEILAVAKQKGTGLWTSQSALELQIPVPTINAAVTMRDLSTFVSEREQENALYPRPIQPININQELLIKQIHNALFVGMIIVYAQGMALLKAASERYSYYIDLESVARIWRGGCIIRAKLLEDIRLAFQLNKNLPNLLLDSNLSKKIMEREENLRLVIQHAVHSGIPVPACMASLSYLDSYRSAWLPANLIQAQRDYFGAHTYERIDAEGSFHTEWEGEQT